MEQNPEENKKKRKNRAKGGLDKIVKSVKEESADVLEGLPSPFDKPIEHDDCCYCFCIPPDRSMKNIEDILAQSQAIMNKKKKADDKKKADAEKKKKKEEGDRNGETASTDVSADAPEEGSTDETKEQDVVTNKISEIFDVVTLLKLANEGNEEAKNKVARMHFLLVMRMARDHGKGRYDLDELFSAGCEGLSRAILAFDTENGARFSTFAGTCIRNAILDYIDKFKDPEIPEKDEDELETDESNEHEDEERPSEEGISVIQSKYRADFKGYEKMEFFLDYISRLGNDDVIDDDGNDTGEQIFNKGENNVDLAFLREYISQSIKRFNQIDQTIIRLRFGLDGNGERTIADIANYVRRSVNATSTRLHNALEALSNDKTLRQYIDN